MIKKSNGVTKEEDRLVHKCPKGHKCKKDGETHLQKTWSYKRMQSFENLSVRWGRSGVNEIVLQEFGGENMEIGGCFQPILPISHKEQKFID